MRCILSEFMLHTQMKIWCLMSKCISHTKMCNVRSHVTHKNIMSRVRTYVTSKTCNIRTYATHEIIFCPNLFYIRRCVMSEHMLHANIRCFLSELMLHTKMCNVRTHFTHENIMSCLPIYVTYKNVMSEHMLHTNMRLFPVRTNGAYENL